MSTAGAAFAVLLATAAATSTARAANAKTVLTVFAETRLLPVASTLDQEIRSTLQSRSPSPIRFYTEYMDLSWFGSPGAADLLSRLLKEKYGAAKIDVIIPCGEPAIRFVVGQRATLFPGVPVAFCTADRDGIRDLPLPPEVTGVTMSIDFVGAAEVALRLHPDTRRIVFIGGSAPISREWEARARRALARFADRVEVSWLTDMRMDEVLASVAAAPTGTVAIFNSFTRDAAGRSFTTPEALSMVMGASRIPVYSFSETLFGHGLIGGPMVDFAAQGTTAAELAWRILQGERLGPADVVNLPSSTYVFDARELKRWRIPEDRLPPGSVVRFHQPSAWDLYKWHIVAALAFAAAEALLITALLVQSVRRKGAEARLDERLRFETLLSELAATFIRIPAASVDPQIEDALRRTALELGLDRASIGEVAAEEGRFRITHSWTRPGVSAMAASLETSRMPWTTARILAGNVVAWCRPRELPPEAERDRATIAALGVRSLLLVPFRAGDRAGVLACSLLRDERSWPEDLVQQVGMLAETFAIVLLRRQAQQALEESEGRFRLMANAAPVMIWIAGPDALWIDFNRAWLEFTGRTLEQEKGDGWLDGVHPDDRKACRAACVEAFAARRAFTGEYRLRRADGVYRSVLFRGVPRLGPDSGIFSGYVGSAIDIAEIRSAQEEVERGREELAHALRVTTLGELTASLAHEINQPLTAILNNAQASRRILGSAQPDGVELDEALGDIASDARRASEIIRKLRALFRKEHADRGPVDVNDAIVEVTSLLRKDLERKKVVLRLDLSPGLPKVLGDLVQLQQVVLNVVLNACDAMDGGVRELRIETAPGETGNILIAVRDSGHGVNQAELDRMFERFVTTKAGGLGMGLSISRSIVEAHGGKIWATRNPDRGLTIHSQLPCVRP